MDHNDDNLSCTQLRILLRSSHFRLHNTGHRMVMGMCFFAVSRGVNFAV